jgi:hypothetical protein
MCMKRCGIEKDGAFTDIRKSALYGSDPVI